MEDTSTSSKESATEFLLSLQADFQANSTLKSINRIPIVYGKKLSTRITINICWLQDRLHMLTETEHIQQEVLYRVMPTAYSILEKFRAINWFRWRILTAVEEHNGLAIFQIAQNWWAKDWCSCSGIRKKMMVFFGWTSKISFKNSSSCIYVLSSTNPGSIYQFKVNLQTITLTEPRTDPIKRFETRSMG